MASARYAPHKTADEVIRRADGLRVKLSQSNDGWSLEGLPFSLSQLGYANFEDSKTPGRAGSLSLSEVNHFLYVCEQRMVASQPEHGRTFELFC